MKFTDKNTHKTGKIFLNITLLISIIIFGIVAFQQKTVCEKTLKYGIGTIDSRFKISRSDFTKLSKEGADIWKKGTGMNIFKYDQNAKFKINLIFDKRQQDTIIKKRSKEILDNKNTSYNVLAEKLKILKTLYNKQTGEYKLAVSEYKKNLDKYNKIVAYWNNNGGASTIEFNKLKQERLVLSNTVYKLNEKTIQIKNSNKKINEIVKEVNSFVNNINLGVDTYNNDYGKAKIFDQGEYTGKEINIYQFDTKKDLRIVLAHELGHALRLNHVENSKSIMYYLMGKQNMNSPSLSKEDTSALKTECGIK